MGQREFEYTDIDFNHIRDLVVEKTGIVLTDNKKELVYSRMSRRLRDLGLSTFSEYRSFIATGNEVEMEQFTNAITTNLTSFFREKHHFDFLKNEFMPQFLGGKSRGNSLRVWSAGCSTGEEVYSIAMTLKESIPDAQRLDIKLLATDLDSDVLSTAKNGVYKLERVTNLPKEQLRRWFMLGEGSQGGNVKVSKELRALITFRQLNLMEPWPMTRKFDLIFCRNVLIYFDKNMQKRLVNRFSDNLKDEGRLVVGHSENLSKVSERLTLLGKTIYMRSP